jgi:hypothetical protein
MQTGRVCTPPLEFATKQLLNERILGKPTASGLPILEFFYSPIKAVRNFVQGANVYVKSENFI